MLVLPSVTLAKTFSLALGCEVLHPSCSSVQYNNPPARNQSLLSCVKRCDFHLHFFSIRFALLIVKARSTVEIQRLSSVLGPICNLLKNLNLCFLNSCKTAELLL